MVVKNQLYVHSGTFNNLSFQNSMKLWPHNALLLVILHGFDASLKTNQVSASISSRMSQN